MSVYKESKAKQEERKALVAERKACSPLKIVTINALTKQITTLTEDIEELKSRKSQLLSRLKCADDKEALTAEKRVLEMEKARERLTQIQEKLPAQTNEIAGEYTRMVNAIPVERWNQVKDRMRIIFYDHWQSLLEKLKGIYGASFNRELYDDAQRHVNSQLPERVRVEDMRSKPQREETGIQAQTEIPKFRRRDENVL